MPCIHQALVIPSKAILRYLDPNPVVDDRRFAPHLELLRSKRLAVLAVDKVSPQGNRGAGYFERTGYVAVYAIDEVILDETGLGFIFTERLEEIG